VSRSLKLSKYGLSKIGVAAATLAFAAILAIAAIFSVAPMHYAVGNDRDDDHDYDHHQDHDQDHDQGKWHQWRDKHVQEQRYPVYAPPSLYYPQPASTGITLVFPIDIR
jgi:hypothetical protein